MRPNLLVLIAVSGVLAFEPLAGAQDTRDDEGDKHDEKIARIYQLLSEKVTTANVLPEKMPFGEFLTAIEGLLPKERKCSLAFDKLGLGKDLDAITTAEVRCPRVRNVSLFTVLR